MIAVKREGAASALRGVRDGVSSIAAELDLLHRRLLELDSAWEGDAREAFSAAVREWQRDMAGLRSIAHSAHTLADSAVTRIDEMDRRRARAWGG